MAQRRAAVDHSRARRTLRRVGIVVGAVFLLIALIYVARRPILTALGEYLTVSDELGPADVIFVLGGEANVRPAKAAELYAAGLAPRIVIPRPEDYLAHAIVDVPNVTDVAVMVMERLGVPDSAIVLLESPGGSTSTIDDVRLLKAYIEQSDVRSVIAVTSMFHTRRTRWILRRLLDEERVSLRMVPAADPRFDETNWWTTEPGLLAYVEEYLKWLHNRGQL